MQQSNTTAMVSVDFYGDRLEAVERDGKVWASLRRFCENLGLDLATQMRKLKGKAWAVMGEMTMTGPDGKSYTTTVISLDTLPGWLFSIDARKVAEHLREKLARYQREAAKVLADHFFGRAPTAPAVPLPDFAALIQQMGQAIVRELREGTTGTHRIDHLVTVEDRMRQRWGGAGNKDRRRVRDVAIGIYRERLGRHPLKLTGHLNGAIAFEREHLDILDRAVDIVMEEAEGAQVVPLFLARPSRD